MHFYDLKIQGFPDLYMSKALGGLSVFPSIKTHIGLALFTMLNKQVTVAAFIVLLQNNKKSTTQAPPLKNSNSKILSQNSIKWQLK